MQVLVDVQGYFDGEPSTSGFTPLNSRVFDSRSPSVPLAANSVTTVQVGGVPAGSNSLAGVALNVQVLPGTADGYLRMWSGDQAEPTSTSTINFDNTRASKLAFIQPAVSTRASDARERPRGPRSPGCNRAHDNDRSGRYSPR